jgi:hypothetical protein
MTKEKENLRIPNRQIDNCNGSQNITTNLTIEQQELH